VDVRQAATREPVQAPCDEQAQTNGDCATRQRE
jgi:hypothetical protein